MSILTKFNILYGRPSPDGTTPAAAAAGEDIAEEPQSIQPLLQLPERLGLSSKGTSNIQRFFNYHCR